MTDYIIKRKFKKKPDYLRCFKLFQIKPILTLDEFIDLHKQIFGYRIERSQARGRLVCLRRHGYIRNAGLRVYKRITDPTNEKNDFYYQMNN